MQKTSKKVTVRLDEETQEVLKKEIERMGLDKSEYIRQAIREKANETNISYIERLCGISTMYNFIIDKYGVSESEKRDMRKELYRLWKK